MTISSSDVKKVYEIRDGSEVLGQFSVKPDFDIFF